MSQLKQFNFSDVFLKKARMEKTKVGIVGAGLTGLIAAKELSKNGVEVSIFEKEASAGGRMRTQEIEGWKMDVGFQVLLSAYPYLQKHVDFDKLDVITLDAAATIFRSGTKTTVGDPFRTKNIFWKTVFSDVGSFKDKWLIYKLKKHVDQLSIDEVFQQENKSTIDFLRSFGFSEFITKRFFKPFFGGIFLENELSTSSRMFLFVFKMFAEGKALIPYGGIGDLAKFLVGEMPNVHLHYKQEVKHIENEKIYLIDGREHQFDYVINTIPNYKNRNDSSQWQQCYNLYFQHSSAAIIQTQELDLTQIQID